MRFAARLASEYILIFSSLMSFSPSFRNSNQLLYITSALVILFGFSLGRRITEYQPYGKPNRKAKFAMPQSFTHGTSLFAKAAVPKFCLTIRVSPSLNRP